MLGARAVSGGLALLTDVKALPDLIAARSLISVAKQWHRKERNHNTEKDREQQIAQV